MNRINEMSCGAASLEQPLNLEVPEQKFMIAFYLTTAEVENDRRALNVIAGMRRAVKQGRYIGAISVGYKRGYDECNKSCIIPDDKQASLGSVDSCSLV